jgi:hypothetical protein
MMRPDDEEHTAMRFVLLGFPACEEQQMSCKGLTLVVVMPWSQVQAIRFLERDPIMQLMTRNTYG